jgi:hypothetical protein
MGSMNAKQGIPRGIRRGDRSAPEYSGAGNPFINEFYRMK